MTNDADFLQELESQHRPKRFMPGLVTMVVLGPLHTLELKQNHLWSESIHIQDVFSLLVLNLLVQLISETLFAILEFFQKMNETIQS